MITLPEESYRDICCKCCVLSGRGLCDGLITLPEESYRLWCVVVCDLGTFVGLQRHREDKTEFSFCVLQQILGVRARGIQKYMLMCLYLEAL